MRRRRRYDHLGAGLNLKHHAGAFVKVAAPFSKHLGDIELGRPRRAVHTE